MAVYRSNPDARPDSDYERGRPGHLVVGNRGRLLDPRRTPVSIVEMRIAVGTFVVRIDDFEDEGARWEIPFEDVDRYQFERGASCAEDDTLAAIHTAIARFDRPLVIACDPQTRARTLERLDLERPRAAAWLDAHSVFFAEGGTLPEEGSRDGDARLQQDLRRFMEMQALEEMEEAFARQYVSGPHSGELVKGHAIVLAELGLVPYEGRVVRDPATFAGGWSRERRAQHVTTRLAFTSAMLRRAGTSPLVVYRGLSTDLPLAPPRNRTFVSATWSRAVAESHFESGGPTSTGVLFRQAVPVERVFMTFFETEAMNAQFREAEVVLLHEPGNRAF